MFIELYYSRTSSKEGYSPGKKSLIVKIDIKATYYLIPVVLNDHLCLGMKGEDKVYITAILPFGFKLVPNFLMQWQIH